MTTANHRLVLSSIALLAGAYAAAITFMNIQHVRAMPSESRVMLDRLQPLVAAGQAVSIVETNLSNPVADTGLVTGDVQIRYSKQAFSVSRRVWINPALATGDPGRYLHRLRAGVLRDEQTGLESLFLIEVQQDFRTLGDKTVVNLWRFPLQQSVDGAAITDALAEAQHARGVRFEEAIDDANWRALFARSHARTVRAFPALAAGLIALAALGSLLFRLWRDQPWAVVATTIIFVTPIVSAAPFLTAFGWTPILAAAILGFALTIAIVCAVEQRVLPAVRERFQSRPGGRWLEAALVPVAALAAGTALVVSFASVSVIPWQGLGSASPGALFVDSLIRPAAGLLLGGVGPVLLLTLFYRILTWRNRRSQMSAGDGH